MSCLLLVLSGPAQSWGIQSRFSAVRDTGTEPTKSGVIGLLAAALGRDRSAAIDDLGRLRMAVRVDVEGTVTSDYHTALDIISADAKSKDRSVVSQRYFLCDATFTVALEHQDTGFLDHLDHSLRHPYWPLYLGRRAFPPATPIPRGVTPQSLDDTLATAPWAEPSPRRRQRTRERLDDGATIELRTLTETDPSSATTYRNDQPVSFRPHRHEPRPVRLGTVPLTRDLIDTP